MNVLCDHSLADELLHVPDANRHIVPALLLQHGGEGVARDVLPHILILIAVVIVVGG